MKRWRPCFRLVALACPIFLSPAIANATCGSLPNSLANGQLADASQVMGNFNALLGCVNSNGSVNAGTAGQLGTYSSTGSVLSGESPSDMLDSSFGSAQGSLLYRAASGWLALPPGTTGQVLSTGGPSTNPSWTSLSPGGTSPYYTTLTPPSASSFSLVKATGITATLSTMASGRGVTMNNTGTGGNTMSSMQQPVPAVPRGPVTVCRRMGHVLQYNQKQTRLRRLIAQAKDKGCAVNPADEQLANTPPPTCPAR